MQVTFLFRRRWVGWRFSSICRWTGLHPCCELAVCSLRTSVISVHPQTGFDRFLIGGRQRRSREAHYPTTSIGSLGGRLERELRNSETTGRRQPNAADAGAGGGFRRSAGRQVHHPRWIHRPNVSLGDRSDFYSSSNRNRPILKWGAVPQALRKQTLALRLSAVCGGDLSGNRETLNRSVGGEPVSQA